MGVLPSSSEKNSNDQATVPKDVLLAFTDGDQPTRTCRFSVNGLTCADCSLLVETKLLATRGVLSARVSCLTFEGTVEYQPSLASAVSLVEVINNTGFVGAILRDQLTSEAQQGGKANHLHTTVQVFPAIGAGKLLDEEVSVIRQALLSAPGVASVSEAKRVTATTMPPDAHVLPGVAPLLSTTHGQPNSRTLSREPVKAVEWEVEYDADKSGPRCLLAAVQALHYPAHVLSAVELASRHADGEHSASLLWRMRVPVGVLLSIPMLFLAFIIPAGALGVSVEEALDAEVIPDRQGLSIHTLLSLLLTTPIQFYVGSPLFISAYRAARFSKTANIDTLVVISSSVAYFYSLAIILAKLAGADIQGANTAEHTAGTHASKAGIGSRVDGMCCSQFPCVPVFCSACLLACRPRFFRGAGHSHNSDRPRPLVGGHQQGKGKRECAQTCIDASFLGHLDPELGGSHIRTRSPSTHGGRRTHCRTCSCGGHGHVGATHECTAHYRIRRMQDIDQCSHDGRPVGGCASVVVFVFCCRVRDRCVSRPPRRLHQSGAWQQDSHGWVRTGWLQSHRRVIADG
jgi:copper chaperone CopZ